MGRRNKNSGWVTDSSDMQAKRKPLAKLMLRVGDNFHMAKDVLSAPLDKQDRGARRWQLMLTLSEMFTEMAESRMGRLLIIMASLQGAWMMVGPS